jgi:hypothetical protein|tara:strand:+ start:192 stop:1010 length:819 start_codon:yes stop_codon:yes gene_type:complete
MNPALVGAGIGLGKGVMQGKSTSEIMRNMAVGGATGYLGGLGQNNLTNPISGESLLGGASSSAYPQALLGNASGNINAYGIPETLGNSAYSATNFTAPEASQVVNNSYMPFANDYGTQIDGMKGIGPDMSSQQTFLDTTPSASQNNFGNVQPTDNTLGIAMQENYGYADGNPLKTNAELGPRFDTPVKSTSEELEAAQGGFKKPLYERAFDSVMGYAEKNPIAIAGLGLTAYDVTKETPQQGPDSTFAKTAGVLKQAYSPTGSQMKIRRARG